MSRLEPSGEQRREILPNELPPELAAFLKTQAYACLTHPTDQGTVLIIKVPAHEIQSVRGTIPIRMAHELYEHPAAPVIRLRLTLYDQPATPLALETFINVEDPQQQDDFAALATQTQLPMLCYDEQLRHRLTKVLVLRDPTGVFDILQAANRLLAAIPPEQVNFDQAKADVLRTTQL
jgi:hypothetical protein